MIGKGLIHYKQRAVAINRQYVVDYLLEHPCSVCGETDIIVLDFDHIDGYTKLYNVSELTARTGLSKLKREVAKCIVLCSNCHRRKTATSQKTYRYLAVNGIDWRTSDNKSLTLRREYIFKYFEDHFCIDCGEKDILVLDFDHLGDKSIKVSDILKSTKESIAMDMLLAEIAKCVVRCSNCHRRKTMIEQGSYRVRAARGEKIYVEQERMFSSYALTDKQILDMREEYAIGDISMRELAAKYNISRGVIFRWIK